MTVSYVKFGLQDRYINHWLAAGPQAVPFNEFIQAENQTNPQQIANQLLDTKSNIINSAVERGPLNEGKFKVGGYTGEWQYYRCREDHLVDLSSTYSTSQVVRAWAYTQLYCPSEQQVQFRLTTFGPIEISLNKGVVFRNNDFFEHPQTLPFTTTLKKGTNRILVCFSNLAQPACTLAFSLKAAVEEKQFQVRVPTLIPSLERRNELENVYDRLYLDRDVYAPGDSITLNWPADLKKPAFNDARLQTLSGRIYGQAEEAGKPGQQLILGSSASLAEGPYQAFVMPLSWEYYESNIRITRLLDLWVMGRNRFSPKPYQNLIERRREALVNAASRENHLFAEIAKMALGNWKAVELKPVNTAIAGISRCETDSELMLLGLLGALYRYGNQPEFPQELHEQIKEAAINFQYTPEQGNCEIHRFVCDDRQIILYACQILAGQRYPEAIFSDSQLTGSQQRSAGEARAVRWIRERGAGGFKDWDSKIRYADTLTALSYLIDLAEKEEVWELGSVLMDKILFTIALNSLNGVFGSPQGFATTRDIKSGLLDPTSGITRLLWGMGVFNHHIPGTVSMACLENYELPLIIAEIAAMPPEEILNREHQGAANKVTFRTHHFMLSSVQDYNPGQPGKREHIWQATLGPQAIVYTNHPGCSLESDAHAPNYWLGNGRLPRVAQWKETLIALYQISEDDLLGFTHAYFPTYEFDEYIVRGNTAFARKGNGFLALTARNGLEMIETGPKAFRELRSYGKDNVWICQMGQSSTDGAFSDFQEKIIGQKLDINGLAVTLYTIRDDELKFSWENPLFLNGEQQPISGFKHYDNPFTAVDLPCSEMEIRTDAYLLKLQFGDLPEK